jgi:hypothetical protein
MGNKDKRKEKEKNETLAGPAEPAQLGDPTGPAASRHTLSVSHSLPRGPHPHTHLPPLDVVSALGGPSAPRARIAHPLRPSSQTDRADRAPAPPHLPCTQNRCHPFPFPFLSSLPLPHRLTPPSME